jgi:hypothetical protein
MFRLVNQIHRPYAGMTFVDRRPKPLSLKEKERFLKKQKIIITRPTKLEGWGAYQKAGGDVLEFANDCSSKQEAVENAYQTFIETE